MSTRINLLPWREAERKRKNIEFGIIAGGAALVTLAAVISVLLYFEDRTAYHEQRNNFLKSEIAVLNSKLETIKELEETKQNLLSRMNIIQELQRSRPEIVHLFEELVVTIPDGIWLTEIQQSGDSISIKGKTESNARVSAFMRNLDESTWIKAPKLLSIEKGKDRSDANFHLTLTQDSPISESEDE